MKKYKLKKDLPTFKAGEEFEISKSGNLIRRGEVRGKAIVAYAAQTLEKFPNILKDWFEEIPEEPKTVWDLKDGDEWYFINYNSKHCYVSHTFDKGCLDAFLEVGNVFLTQEEVEKALARRKAKQILLRDTKGFKPDWGNGDQMKYYVSYHYLGHYFNVDFCWSVNEDRIYFATYLDAAESLKNHRKEWLTYLGVEE